MANRNHQLDDPIILAAREEFMESGYEKASLRKIASRAGVTVGAIYTRYKTKDQLFCSLAAPLIQRIEEAFGGIREEYYTEGAAGLQGMGQSMKVESDRILHLLFDDYDSAVLLLCRSTGSSLEKAFDRIVEEKIQETQSFFHGLGVTKMDDNVLRLLISAQFHMYFEVIEGGFGLEEAKHLMNKVMTYHAGGWMALLSEAM